MLGGSYAGNGLPCPLGWDDDHCSKEMEQGKQLSNDGLREKTREETVIPVHPHGLAVNDSSMVRAKAPSRLKAARMRWGNGR